MERKGGDRANRGEMCLSWLTLFASSGTLVCCALPILLVSLGLGATMASLISAFPFLSVLSQHKLGVFGFSAVMLSLSGWILYRPGRACPADPDIARLCHRSQAWNRRIYWVSMGIWSLGFFTAYLALPLRIWFQS